MGIRDGFKAPEGAAGGCPVGVPGDDPPVIPGVIRKRSRIIGEFWLVRRDQRGGAAGAEVHVVGDGVPGVWVSALPAKDGLDGDVDSTVRWRGAAGWVGGVVWFCTGGELPERSAGAGAVGVPGDDPPVIQSIVC